LESGRRKARARRERPQAQPQFEYVAIAKRVLLAGASGIVGTAIAVELKRRGYWVRALSRFPLNVKVDVDELFVGDLLKPETLKTACDGIGIVFSCAGAPPHRVRFRQGKPSFAQIDDVGNRYLLAEALEAGVKRFAYVGAFGGRLFGSSEYIRAHESFALALRTSGLDHVVVRPTATFASLASMARRARKRKLRVIGDGSARINPIHEEDLAVVCVDAMEGHESAVDVGGPVTYTRNEIAEAALSVWGRSSDVGHLRSGCAFWIQRFSSIRGTHNRSVGSFLTDSAVVDMVAPAFGSRTLEAYLAAIAKAETAS
jgi:uncharacterized protein YbjT (DUF2867 family)